MKYRGKIRAGLAFAAVFAAVHPIARAAEHITLSNGFELDCVRREAAGDRVRLYLAPAPGATAGEATGYLEVATNAVLRVETIADVPVPAAQVTPAAAATVAPKPATTAADVRQLLVAAGTRHNIDVDLLAALVLAESGGQTLAVSRAGARGLMQLMPGTAAALGVHDSFAADQNIAGGTAYLDALLTKYHDNMAFALAAYNTGPAAVDRYHGIPPYPETRAYVSRIIREFNRRKQAALVAAAIPPATR
jgi:soluble lytic murein transglycosylase-like protein